MPTSTENFYVEGPVSRALSMLGVDKQKIINMYGKARSDGLFPDTGSSGSEKRDKDNMLRISMPHIQAMFKSGKYDTDLLKNIGMTAKRSWAGYSGEDADTKWGHGGGKGSGGSSSKPKKKKRWGAGGKNPVNVKTPPGDPWNANNWNPYTPISGFVQGFQPWNPINFSLDPSLQGTQPTFQPGGFMDPVPEWNPNVPAWPNFPAPSPPPNVIPSGGGGGGGGFQGYVNNARPSSLDHAPSRIDPYGPGPGGQGDRMDAPNLWYMPGGQGQQGGGAINDLWRMVDDFFRQNPGAINDVWGGGGGGGGRTLAPDPWAFLY
jgi:hypothetical protein